MTLAEALLIHHAVKGAAYHKAITSLGAALSKASGGSIEEKEADKHILSLIAESHSIVSSAVGYDVVGGVCLGCKSGIGCLFPQTCEWPKE